MQIYLIKKYDICKKSDRMIISLLGYMGSGKSTVGKYLAKSLNITFIDLDEYISAQENKSIQEIFSIHGEIYFRKKENFYLNELLNGDNIVLSLGGGTPIYHRNMDKIKEKSFSFYLKMNASELAKRLSKEKEHRPLIAHLEEKSLPEFIAKHLFERSTFYESAAYRIAVNQKTPEEISNEIIDVLKNTN